MATVRIESAVIPAHLKDEVCGCGSRKDGFTNHLLNGNFWYYVCGNCHKPAPLNAVKAGLIRECEMCEDWYFVDHYPDRDDICGPCNSVS